MIDTNGAATAIAGLRDLQAVNADNAARTRESRANLIQSTGGLLDAFERRRQEERTKNAMKAIGQHLGIDPNSPVWEDPRAAGLEIQQRAAENREKAQQAFQIGQAAMQHENAMATQGMIPTGRDATGRATGFGYQQTADPGYLGWQAQNEAAMKAGQKRLDEARDYEQKQAGLEAQMTAPGMTMKFGPMMTTPLGAIPTGPGPLIRTEAVPASPGLVNRRAAGMTGYDRETLRGAQETGRAGWKDYMAGQPKPMTAEDQAQAEESRARAAKIRSEIPEPGAPPAEKPADVRARKKGEGVRAYAERLGVEYEEGMDYPDVKAEADRVGGTTDRRRGEDELNRQIADTQDKIDRLMEAQRKDAQEPEKAAMAIAAKAIQKELAAEGLATEETVTAAGILKQLQTRKASQEKALAALKAQQPFPKGGKAAPHSEAGETTEPDADEDDAGGAVKDPAKMSEEEIVRELMGGK